MNVEMGEQAAVIQDNYMNSYPLINQDYEPLIWTFSPWNYPGMVRIGTIGDGSCFFHAIAKAFFVPYQIGVLNGVSIDRIKFIRDLRHDLAYMLAQPIQTNGSRHYDVLSRGKLAEIARELPQYSLENMQKQLDSNSPVDNLYNEYIGNMLNKDIYLLDLTQQDVYVTGNDADILYKNRDGIVILFIPGHYELVGLQTPEGIRTMFHHTDPFIQAIRQRLREKIMIGSGKKNLKG